MGPALDKGAAPGDEVPLTPSISLTAFININQCISAKHPLRRKNRDSFT